MAFELKIVSEPAVNMKRLFQAACSKIEDGKAAHVIVVDSLPNDMKIFHGKNDFGYDSILVKLDSMDKMAGRVSSEVGKIGKKNLPSCSIGVQLESANMNSTQKENNYLSGPLIAALECLFVDLSDALQINCPQLVFSTGLNSAGTLNYDRHGDVSEVLLNPNNDLLLFAVHELRHAWQHKYHAEMFQNYIPLEECRRKYGMNNSVYNSQIAEFDANVFACAIMKDVYNRPGYTTHTPLKSYVEKAADSLIAQWGKENNLMTLIDYKSIYPDLIA